VAEVTTAVVEFPENDQVLASSTLHAMAVGHGKAAEVDTVALEMTLPVRSTPPLRGDALPNRRPGSLVARWVPDPRGESGLICIWVPDAGTEASVSFDA
jgi:hypothetical protein